MSFTRRKKINIPFKPKVKALGINKMTKGTDLHSERRIMMISTHGYVTAEPPLGAPDTGGQVVFVLELSKKIGQFGYKVDLWTRRFDDQPEIEIIDDNVRIIRIPTNEKNFIEKEYLYKSIPQWVKNALGYIRRNKIAYEFIDSHYWDAGLAGQLLSEELEITHMHTPHSLGIWKKQKMSKDYPEDIKSFEEKYNFDERIHYEQQIYRSCDLLIATTPVQIDMLSKDYNIQINKMRMIPPGYDDSRFYAVGQSTRIAIRQQYGYSGPVVFAVSRLANNKGLDLLIAGFSILSKRIPDARLVLAIGYESRNEAEDVIFQNLLDIADEKKIKEKISFIGYIHDTELPDYYRAADLFVLSSRYEPFGMTAVEAMACGTPTVITSHGGLQRILDYGIHTIIADPFDAEDLGISMYKVLKYPKLKERLSDKAAQRARARFTWTGIAQKLLSEVETLRDVHK